MSNQCLIDSRNRDRDSYPLSTDFVIYPKQYAYDNKNIYKNPIAITTPNIHSGYGYNTIDVVDSSINYTTIPVSYPIPTSIPFNIPVTVVKYISQYCVDVYFPPLALDQAINQNVFANCTLVTRVVSKPAGSYLKADIVQSLTFSQDFPKLPFTRLFLKTPGLQPYPNSSAGYSYLDASSGDPYCIFNNAPESMHILSYATNNQVNLNPIYTKIPVNIYDTQGNKIGISTTGAGDPYLQYYVMLTDTDIINNITPLPVRLNRGQPRKIIYYNNTTGVAQLDNSLPSNYTLFPPDISSGYSYEVYKAQYEGLGTLWFNNGIKDKNYSSCRDITLNSLVLPNYTLSTGLKGALDNYSYLVLYINNVGGKTSSLSTNNPETYGASFIIPLYLQLATQKFFTLSPSIKKSFKLDFNMPIKVKLCLPTGEVVKFAGSEQDNVWVTNYNPLFLKSIPDYDYTDTNQTVKYPGYSPDTPVPFSPYQSVQFSVLLDFDC